MTSSAYFEAARKLETSKTSKTSNTFQYRISTITGFSKATHQNSAVNLNTILENTRAFVKDYDDNNNEDTPIRLIQLAMKDQTVRITRLAAEDLRKLNPALVKTRKASAASAAKEKGKTQKNNFGNQMSLSVSVDNNPVSIKIFKNGSLHVAGLRNIEDWRQLGPYIGDWMKKIDVKNVMDPENIVQSLKVCMICADFNIGMRFKPITLLRVLRENMPLLLSSHEPCRHNAVKIKYMHNVDDPIESREGICKCAGDAACKGKGNGTSRDSGCRKVTVLLFHSGKVIITGAVTLQQVHDAYTFVVERVCKPYGNLFRLDV